MCVGGGGEGGGDGRMTNDFILIDGHAFKDTFCFHGVGDRIVSITFKINRDIIASKLAVRKIFPLLSGKTLSLYLKFHARSRPTPP